MRTVSLSSSRTPGDHEVKMKDVRSVHVFSYCLQQPAAVRGHEGSLHAAARALRPLAESGHPRNAPSPPFSPQKTRRGKPLGLHNKIAPTLSCERLLDYNDSHLTEYLSSCLQPTNNFAIWLGSAALRLRISARLFMKPSCPHRDTIRLRISTPMSGGGFRPFL